MMAPLAATDDGLAPARRMRMRFKRAAEEAWGHVLAAAPTIVKTADIAGLPPAARRYMQFMGVVGQPRAQSFRAHWGGRFRLTGLRLVGHAILVESVLNRAHADLQQLCRPRGRPVASFERAQDGIALDLGHRGAGHAQHALANG
jgi:hypothetical protein